MDKGSDCDAQGPGFESSLKLNFKVSRLYKRRNCHFFSRANKSVNFNILTKNFLLKFITQSYLKIDHNSKQIDFLVNYTTIYAVQCTKWNIQWSSYPMCNSLSLIWRRFLSFLLWQISLKVSLYVAGAKDFVFKGSNFPPIHVAKNLTPLVIISFIFV